MERLSVIQERRGENRLIVRMNGHENDYYLFGGKDEGSYALIQGMTLAGVLFDEVAPLPRSFVVLGLARCCGHGSIFWLNCFPEGPTHWFYQSWLTRAEERNLLYLHFTMEDNPALSPAIRQRYERLYSGVFYQRYVQGLWAAAKGLIYDMFRPEVHITQDLPDAGQGCYVSVDYGTQNPTVFLLWQKGERGRWYCLREYYWSGRDRMRQKTDGEYAADLEVFLDGVKPRAVIVDPSAASFIALLRQRGYPVLGADNQVLTVIRRVGDLLREERLLFSPACIHTIEEFRSYVWDEDGAGQDRPVKEHDHCMDALRYFVSTVPARSQAHAGKRPKGL